MGESCFRHVGLTTLYPAGPSETPAAHTYLLTYKQQKPSTYLLTDAQSSPKQKPQQHLPPRDVLCLSTKRRMPCSPQLDLSRSPHHSESETVRSKDESSSPKSKLGYLRYPQTNEECLRAQLIVVQESGAQMAMDMLDGDDG